MDIPLCRTLLRTRRRGLPGLFLFLLALPGLAAAVASAPDSTSVEIHLLDALLGTPLADTRTIAYRLRDDGGLDWRAAGGTDPDGHLTLSLDALGSGARYIPRAKNPFGSGDVLATGPFWLNRHLASFSQSGRLRAASFGSELAQSLRGPVSVSSFNDLSSFNLGLDPDVEQALLDRLSGIYAQSPSPATAYRRLVQRAGGVASDNLRQDIGLELATVNIGGWDTHNNQGGANGNQVNGGTVYGIRPGLRGDQLYRERYLAFDIDYRNLLGEVLTELMGNPDPSIVFTGPAGDPGDPDSPAAYLPVGFIH